MPDCDRIHLPSWDSHRFVYERYKQDVISQGCQDNELVSLRSFYQLWKEDFSNVVIPEVSVHVHYFLCGTGVTAKYM